MDRFGSMQLGEIRSITFDKNLIATSQSYFRSIGFDPAQMN